MFGQTSITHNTVSGKGAEVEFPPGPQRSLLTGKEFVFLGSGFLLLASGLVGCTNIQQPNQPSPSTEPPIPPTDTTSQVKETTLPTQTPPPPTSTLPLPTATSTDKLPTATPKEEQPPTLENCKTMPVDVYSKYATEEKKKEMQDLVLGQGESIDDFRYNPISYSMPTDGSFITDPYCIKTKDGTTIGVARLSTLVYYADGDKAVAILLPLIIDLGNAMLAWGGDYWDENAGYTEAFIQERVNQLIQNLPKKRPWEPGYNLLFKIPNDPTGYLHKYGPENQALDGFYLDYYKDREDVLAGNISQQVVLLPPDIDIP